MMAGKETQTLTTSRVLRLLRGVVDTLPVLINVKDSERRYIFVNRYLCDYYGDRPEDVLGKTAEEIMPLEAVDPINETDRLVLREGLPTGMWEVGETDRDGHPRQWVVGKWPLLDPDTGAATNIVTMAFDITGLHVAREAGLERERQIEAITSRAPVMLLKTVLKPDGTSTIPFMAGRMAEDFGLDAEALARDGNAVLDIVHPDDREMLAASWRASRARGERNTAEFRVLTSRGEVRWVSSIATHRHEPDGTVISDEVVVDVTELHVARERAKERERQIATLAQSVPGAIARRITRPDGSATIPFIAGEFVSVLGIDLDAVSRDASAAWSRVHPDDRERLDTLFRSSLESLEPFENTARFIAPDGSTRWYRSRSAHHRDDEGNIITDTVTIDVTEEKLAEQQLRRERELLQSVTANIPGLVFRRIDGPGSNQRYDFIEGDMLGAFGVTSADALADPNQVWRHFVPEDLESARKVIGASLRDLRPYSYTARCRVPATGQILWIEVSATPRTMDGVAVVTDGIAVDVTRRVEAEREAQEQRALLQQVIDTVPAAINVKDREGRLTLANRALADYYGVAPEELLWTAPVAIEDSDDEDRITREWDLEVLESGHISEAREFTYVDPKGRTRHWLGRKSPLRNPNTGAMDRVVTVSLDITDRVVAERRAQEAEFRLGSIIENLPGMVLRRIHNPDGSIDYAYAAGRMARDLGFTSDSKATRATWDIMLAEDRDRMQADLRRMVETMQPLVALNRYRYSDGSIRWSQNISQPRRLEDGTVVSDAILLDVTDRQTAEEQARQRDELLRSVASSIPGAIVRWRVDSRDLIEQGFAAGQFVETGQIILQEGQASLAAFWPALVPEDGQRLVRELNTAADRRGSIELDLRTRVEDETRWIKMFGRFRARVAEDAAWDLILLDATESKRYEEQLRIAQKMDAIGNLTGGIAHDFNNILAVIVASLDLLMDGGGMAADDRQLADAALHAAERGADLTGRLLAFARNQPAEPQTFDGNARLESFAQLMRRSLGPEIELDLRCNPDLPKVIVDPAQFESALMNLVVNARDASEGRGRIVIETTVTKLETDDQRPPSLEPGTYVVFTVTDFGHGMTPEVQRRAFEPLFTTKSEGRGTGFGLPMVYNFAKQAGGHVTLYSESGMGTTVRIYLPAARDEDVEPAAAAPQPSPPTSARGARILVTDDNVPARHAVASQLTRHGYVVVEADQATEALELAQAQGPFDLLITDVIMPGGLNGVELADRLRREHPALPVLLTSGYTADALAERRLELGRYELIGKPFRQRELLTAVARLLGET